MTKIMNDARADALNRIANAMERRNELLLKREKVMNEMNDKLIQPLIILMEGMEGLLKGDDE